MSDCHVEARQDALPIVGVDPLVPPRGGIAQLRSLIIEQWVGAFVPDQPIGHQIPVPDRFLRGLGKQTVALSTFPKGDLGMLSLGDILDGRQQLDGLTFGSGHQRDVDQGPDDLARRPDIPLLHGIGPAFPGQEQPEGLTVGRRIVRMGSRLDRIADQIVP